MKSATKNSLIKGSYYFIAMIIAMIIYIKTGSTWDLFEWSKEQTGSEIPGIIIYVTGLIFILAHIATDD